MEKKHAATEKKNAAMEVQIFTQQEDMAEQQDQMAQMVAMEMMMVGGFGGLDFGNSSKTSYPLDVRASWDSLQEFSDRSRSHSPASGRSQSPPCKLNAEERLVFMEIFLQRSRSSSPSPHPI